MPNWCLNTLNITHPDAAQLSRLKTALESNRLFEEFVPIPQDLLQEGAATHGGPNAAVYDAIRAANIAKHGYASWYDWCVDHWGTKWDVCDANVTKTIMDGKEALAVGFESAWAPPIEGYRALEQQGFEVEAMYYEPGMCFCGRYTTAGGDEYFEIENNAAWVQDNIPAEINETFAIAESMSDMEEIEN